MEHYQILCKQIRGISASNKFGLFEGVLGKSLFFYQLGEVLVDSELTEEADSFLDAIFSQVEKDNIEKSFSSGISGIGWGIEYLLQYKYVSGDSNDILADIDDQLFQFLAFSPQCNISLENGLLGYGFYYLQRIKDNEDKEACELLLPILCTIINRLSEILDAESDSISEPVHFQTTWNLPFLIFFLSKCYQEGFFEKKILYMFRVLAGSILSYIPIKNSNKLFIGLAIDSIPKTSPFEKWHKHARLIFGNIDYNCILKEEVKCMNPLMVNGMSGLLMLLLNLSPERLSAEAKAATEAIYNKLLHFITTYDDSEKKVKIDSGILKGWAGIGIALLYFENKYPNLNK